MTRAAALALACMALAGCGSSAAQQARDYARAVNLRTSDAPWMSVVGHEQVLPASGVGRLAFPWACGVPAAATEVIAVSPQLSYESAGESSAQSRVIVFASATAAQRSLKALSGSDGLACWRHIRAAQTGRVRNRSLVPASTIAALPARVGSAVRITVRYPAVRPQPRSYLYTDWFAFRSGAAVVLLRARGRGAPEAYEDRLLATIHARAVAHSS